jgi:Holliday junction resolvase RusA-like endonuclease
VSAAVVAFFTAGDAIAQPRVRVMRIGNHVRMGGANKDHKIHSWRAAVRHDALREMAGRPPVDAAIALELTFLMRRPKSMAKKTAGDIVPHTSRPDVDNCVKAVKDALKVIVWLDDSQVSMLFARKRYTVGNEAPGVHVKVWLDEGGGS